jgi:hypothetical protein
MDAAPVTSLQCAHRCPSRASKERAAIPLIATKQRSTLTATEIMLLQFTSLFHKRVLQWMRSPRLLMVMFFLPVILAIVGLGVVSNVTPVEDEPLLLFNLQRGYSSNTMYYSDNDAGGDHYSGALAATAAALGRDGTRAAVPLQVQLGGALSAVLGGDSRFSVTRLASLSGANVTELLLGAARDYYVSLFYRRNLVGLTTQPGAFRLQNGGAACSLRVDNAFAGPTPLTLVAGQAYEFVLTKSAAADGLSVSTSASNAPGAALPTTQTSASNLTRVDSGRISAVRWTVPSSLVGSTVYLFCASSQTTGLPLTITADPTLGSSSTGGPPASSWFLYLVSCFLFSVPCWGHGCCVRVAVLISGGMMHGACENFLECLLMRLHLCT